jgi:phosphotransferase system  glucose/maltose/N-acetylglucosamine-specific IIC component
VIVFLIVVLALFGIAALLVFLANVINLFLPPDLKLPPSAVYYPLIIAIAVTVTLATGFVYVLFKNYRSKRRIKKNGRPL